MKPIPLLGLALILLSLLTPGSAHAQATRTWVSGVGDDANPCSRTAPCKTVAGAISKTAPGGEINALDPGGFGAVTITKSITIDGGGGQIASVLVAGTNGIIVSAAATDVVILRNIRLDGLLGNGSSSASAGINGVRFLSGKALIIENCDIFGFSTWGIDFEPQGSSAPASVLSVINTVLSNNGISSVANSGGILVAPHAGFSAKAMITGTKLTNNNIGVKSLGDNTSGFAQIVVDNSQSFGNLQAGFAASSGGGAGNGPAQITLNAVDASENSVGVQSSGANALVLIGNSLVQFNGTGVQATNGGNAFSYKNNQINNNAIDGTPITPVGLN